MSGSVDQIKYENFTEKTNIDFKEEHSTSIIDYIYFPIYFYSKTEDFQCDVKFSILCENEERSCQSIEIISTKKRKEEYSLNGSNFSKNILYIFYKIGVKHSNYLKLKASFKNKYTIIDIDPLNIGNTFLDKFIKIGFYHHYTEYELPKEMIINEYKLLNEYKENTNQLGEDKLKEIISMKLESIKKINNLTEFNECIKYFNGFSLDASSIKFIVTKFENLLINNNYQITLDFNEFSSRILLTLLYESKNNNVKNAILNFIEKPENEEILYKLFQEKLDRTPLNINSIYNLFKSKEF